MIDKHTHINTAGFKNGLFVTLGRVYGDGGITYEAVVYGRSNRGTITRKSSFRHSSRGKVCRWREARRADSR